MNNFSKFISDPQHGFYSQMPTVMNLLTFTYYLYDEIADGDQIDVIYTDFSKAFDNIDIVKLIARILELDLPLMVSKILISYLTDRKNRVFFNGYLSEYYLPTSGVPQGSNRGPSLFLVFINSLITCLSCPVEIFADDTKQYLRVRSVRDFVSLQKNIIEFTNWCIEHQLVLSVKKCIVMTFGGDKNPIIFVSKINNISLDRVYTHRGLGILHDNKLTFNFHIH